MKIFKLKRPLSEQKIAEKLGLVVVKKITHDFITFCDQLPHRITPNCSWATRFQVGLLIDKKTLAFCIFKNDPLYPKICQIADKIG